jgi:Ca2+-binding EF-hand superfamily protein
MGAAGKKKALSSPDEILVNTHDIDELVHAGGVDLEIVKKQAFPSLMFENKTVIERMFDFIKGEVDIHTKFLPFESFLNLVVQFNTKNVT